MFSRKEIVVMVSDVVVVDDAVMHISDMLEGIQKFLYKQINDKTFRTSKFMELCAREKWEFASQIADSMNKQILETTLFRKFVKKVKTSSDYISLIREKKLNILC